MKKIKVNKALAYFVGYDATLIILNIIYDIDDAVKIMYVVNGEIIGYITTKKIYYTNKGAYIIWCGYRRYLYEFAEVDFHGREFISKRVTK